MGALPPVFIEFLGRATGFNATARGVKTELATTEAASASSMGKMSMVSKAAFLGIGIAAGVMAVKLVNSAADFQTAMTRVRTGAGETAGNMKTVSDGVLTMAGKVGESTQDLTSGLYTVESAGYHGADALKVLQTSAIGAKVGAADLATVTDATTTALNAYKLKAADSTKVMNALVATEAHGKTNMEALAGAMSSILPVSAAAGVGLNEVLGAMATMTSQGTSAKVAATYLRQTIGQLANPTAKAAAAMKAIGLSSVDVAKNLGSHGLASTLTMLTDAIQKHMGPAGTVIMSTLTKAAGSATDFQGALNKLSGPQKTYIGALATMVGGTKSMMGALQLTGPHMADFQKNTALIGKQVQSGGKEVEGWSDVQKTFNQRMAEAKGSLQAIGIQIGTALLPAATKMIGVFSEGVTWMTKHKSVAIALGAAIGGILAVGFAVAAVAAWEFTAAILANPVTWIIVGIMALIAGIVLLITHWKQVSAWLSGAWKATVNGLVTAWHWLASETSNVWNNDIVAPLKRWWNDIANWFNGAWHTVTDPIVGAWNWVGTTTSNVWNNDIVAPVKHAWSSVATWITAAWHTVADPIVGAWHWISSTTSAVWNGITSFFRKWWPLLLLVFAPAIAVIVGAWNRWHTQITDTVHTVWGAITSYFTTKWNEIVLSAQIIWALIHDYIVKPVQQVWTDTKKVWDSIESTTKTVWDTISGWISGKWKDIVAVAKVEWAYVESHIVSPLESAWGSIKSIWNTISKWLGSVWGQIVSGVKTDWALVKSYIINPLTSAWHSVETVGSNIQSSIYTAMYDAWSTVKDVGSWFEGIGIDIVNGIISGISGAASYLYKSLKNLAKNALSYAKSFLDINSPSRVFAKEVGHWIPAGIAQGIDDNAAIVGKAVGNATPSSLGSPSFSAGAPAIASAGGGQVVHQVNVHVQGSVLSENDLRNTVQKEFLRLGSRNSNTWQPFKR